jgi:23S rRNA (adenine2030-N6)-methyltransferase
LGSGPQHRLQDRDMNYRHAFHAGNHGDVLKHLVLLGVIEALSRKDAPWFALDTHAGPARYDLDSIEARRSGEADAGIRRVAVARDLPPLAARYVQLVRKFDAANDDRIRHYPGSPHLVAALLRAQDRAAFVELEPDEAALLKGELHHDRRIGIHCRDGYEALRGLLPPREKRGLVLIDPPYELQAAEFDVVREALADAHGRFAAGVLMAWYPIKDATASARFHTGLQRAGLAPTLAAELMIHRRDSRVGLNGSGVVVINPPWQLDEILGATLPAVLRALAPSGAGETQVRWLIERP